MAKKYRVLKYLEWDGAAYQAGSTIELDDQQSSELIQDGSIELEGVGEIGGGIAPQDDQAGDQDEEKNADDESEDEERNVDGVEQKPVRPIPAAKTKRKVPARASK